MPSAIRSKCSDRLCQTAEPHTPVECGTLPTHHSHLHHPTSNHISGNAYTFSRFGQSRQTTCSLRRCFWHPHLTNLRHIIFRHDGSSRGIAREWLCPLLRWQREKLTGIEDMLGVKYLFDIPECHQFGGS